VNKEENTKILEIDKSMRKIPFGKFLNIYNCRTANRKALDYVMVGGVTTTLLKHILKKNIVDIVIAVDFEEGKIFPSAALIKEPKLIEKTAGSRYLPSFSLSILKDIINNEEIQKIAIVTVPCQAYVIEKLREIDAYKKYVDKIDFIFTLICGNGFPSREEVESFLETKGIDTKKELNVYREKELKKPFLNPMNKNRYVYISKGRKEKSLSSKDVFRSRGKITCGAICPDYTGIASDISLGGSGMSKNLVITRSEKGDKLLKDTIFKEKILQRFKFSSLNKIVVKFMGNHKREKIREVYKETFT
jgi:coenzyme F420-reducing hydrogenase beta subunit